MNGDFVDFGFVFNGMDAGYFALAQCFYGYGVGGRLLVELPFAFAVEVFDESFGQGNGGRSEEHTSELQSRPHLVCRLLLEKKKSTRTYSLRLASFSPSHHHSSFLL